MRQNQAQIDANLEILAQSTARLKAANDALERRNGLFQIGGRVVLEAVTPAGGNPTIRQNGRDRMRFSNASGPQAAEAAAKRTFGKLVGRELTRLRTEDELRATLHIEQPK